jgi:hypothetical protein
VHICTVISAGNDVRLIGRLPDWHIGFRAATHDDTITTNHHYAFLFSRLLVLGLVRVVRPYVAEDHVVELIYILMYIKYLI